jgi:RNA polymerase sigma-70 factor (ECF subfamily)
VDPAGVESAVSDQELAARAAGGRDPAAEAELVRRLAPRVRLYGFRHLRDASAADDLVQEALVLTLERLRAGRIRQPERLASFVFGACRLLVRNQRRGRQRRDALLARFSGELAQEARPDPLRLDERRLRDCLIRLAERERSLLVLTFYAEAPPGEIAGRLGLSPDNVRTLRHRALGRLRRCVEGRAA